VADPRDNVPDELEDRLDNLSATLTDDEVSTTWSAGATGVLDDADADADDADADDADDADDTGL
jgi:hypothetical protein